MTPSDDRRARPEISVVIPTLRRYGQLTRVLDALERQELPPAEFEVVVASDAKEEDGERVDAAIGRRPYAARRLQASVAGASGARNCGWRAAAAALVLFLDDDIQPRPPLLAEHLAWHRRHPAAEIGVLGHVSWSPELRLTPFMRFLDEGLQFGFGGIEGTEARWSQLYTANVSLKRVMLERVGGFDEQAFPFGYEDMDLARRLEPLGFRLLYNRAAHADHLHAVTIEEWKGTVARIATAERDFVRRYPDVEPYYFKVLTRPSKVPLPWRLSAPLARVVSPRLPWLGRRVWAARRASYRRALAPSFLAAWDRAGGAERTSPGGPRVRERRDLASDAAPREGSSRVAGMAARPPRGSGWRAHPLVDQPMSRVRLRGRVLHPYWRFRLYSFGEGSVLHKPVWLRGAHKVAVGRDCVLLWPELTVWRSAWQRRGPAITIGDRVTVRPFTAIAAAESVVIEDDVTIAGLSLVIDGTHEHRGAISQVGRRRPTDLRPVRIGAGTKIGERVAVLPGSNIGSHCHVRANSVVQGRIPDHSIVAGFPARVVGDVREREHGAEEPTPATMSPPRPGI